MAERFFRSRETKTLLLALSSSAKSFWSCAWHPRTLCETSASRIAGNLPNYDCGLALEAAERGPGCSLHPPLLSSLYVAVIIQRRVASGVDIALDNERVEIKV